MYTAEALHFGSVCLYLNQSGLHFHNRSAGWEWGRGSGLGSWSYPPTPIPGREERWNAKVLAFMPFQSRGPEVLQVQHEDTCLSDPSEVTCGPTMGPVLPLCTLLQSRGSSPLGTERKPGMSLFLRAGDPPTSQGLRAR